ncbi:metallophosphoesterase family protein [Candidatus Uabimicrobium amorphum]|uniref:Nuclease SbcCD subunit D n=1 Tax=Uabimicrobium amorphum TaxID=2596890 RepID=A0A5S9IJJ3_UABAM|nr:exonuclease subunit SbcD [Candidatus Uabimicrobium amorphum]BBM82220.1 Nuclease SbcCD subunit D [Candidatus Uabimicrobium amorphum]
MIKFIHTGDWHVGKTIRGKHRGGEYRAILDELYDFIVAENIELLLVAGDIYDTPTPSAEAESIIYSFFHRVSSLGVKSIVVAGNHDSSLRFEAISQIMALANVTMVGKYDFENPQNCVCEYTSKDGEDKLSIGLVPFIFERMFIRAQDIIDEKREETTMRYSRGMTYVLNEISKHFAADTTQIMVGHLLMHGARPGGGERRLYLGDNYAVHPVAIPKNVSYFALAHVHMYQQIEGPCPTYYCGSPLQMDFGEAEHEKGFLCGEIADGKVSTPRFIPFKSGVRLQSISGTIAELEDLLAEDNHNWDNFHLKITIKTDASTLGLSHKIKQQFPNAVDIRREFIGEDTKQLIAQDSPTWLPDLYRDFHNNHYERAADPEIIEEFLQLYEECSEEE